MLSVGLTGNIASGKSEVARLLVARGARLIDADVLAREVVEPGTPGLAAIVARWGKSMLDSSGRLDRAAMRALVFSDPAARSALEEITHPRIEARRRQLEDDARGAGAKIVVHDIPLLFEKHMEQRFDVVVLVDARVETRLARLTAHRGLARADAMRMIEAQMPSSSKRARADIVIDNEGTLDDLSHRVADVWDDLVRRASNAGARADRIS